MSQIKASTLCASSALLVLGGFMSVNLAGCGGGGGGGNGGSFGQATATPASQGITFRLQRQDGGASNGGTVQLTPSSGTTGGVLRATANTSGVASIPTVPPGTYAVTFTVVSAAGTPLSTTNSTVVITRNAGQTFLLLQDQNTTGLTGAFSVSGIIRLNTVAQATATPAATATPGRTPGRTPSATATTSLTPAATATIAATPIDPSTFSNCTSTSQPVTASLLVEVLDLSKDQQIIAQLRRTATDSSGRYTIFLPYKPTAFRVRVGQFDQSGAQFAGFSRDSNFNGATDVNGVPTVRPLDVCVNLNGRAPIFPRATPTSTPTATATATSTPVGTPAATPVATATATPAL